MSPHNQYSLLVTVVDKVDENKNEIDDHSSTSTVAALLTSNDTLVHGLEKEHSFEVLNSSETTSKVPENVVRAEVDNRFGLTIAPSDTPNKYEDNLPLKLGEPHTPEILHKGDAFVKGEHPMKIQLNRLVRGEEGLAELESSGLSCSYEEHSDLCVITQPIILEKKQKSFTIYTPSSQTPQTEKIIRPYPKKEDENTMMNWVNPVKIIQGKVDQIHPPSCDVKHNVPVHVFSFGGFTDNYFHKFSEVIIPLFITSRHFESKVQFAVTDNLLGENWKFSKVLKHLSDYDVIDANERNDRRVHCFPGAVIGLRYFGNLEVNNTDTPGGYTMSNFKQFLRESYNLNVRSTLKPKRPKVLFISRKSSRSFLNEDKMMRLMKKMGLRIRKVKPNEMSNLDRFAKIVNSCDMMVGAHGAGLTNQVFLPDGAVVVQIVPLGLEWASENYFGKPAINMGLKYLQYKIEAMESSLYDLYGPNNPIVSDPSSIWAKGFGVVKELYIDGQHIRVDLHRFKSTLLEAIKLLR